MKSLYVGRINAGPLFTRSSAGRCGVLESAKAMHLRHIREFLVRIAKKVCMRHSACDSQTKLMKMPKIHPGVSQLSWLREGCGA